MSIVYCRTGIYCIISLCNVMSPFPFSRKMGQDKLNSLDSALNIHVVNGFHDLND